jgi:hypothetical protein
VLAVTRARSGGSLSIVQRSSREAEPEVVGGTGPGSGAEESPE